jgi:hypothetical protein
MSGTNRPRQNPQSQSSPNQQTTFTTKSALNGHGAAVATCLLSGQQRTSFARSELFAF